MSRRFRKRTCLLIAALVCACTSKRTEISIEPNSTADSLVFRVGSAKGLRPTSLGILRVDECAVLLSSRGTFPDPSRAAWVMEAVPGQAPRVNTIVYGYPPKGYRDLQPAHSLRRPGCYAATISGTGAVGFEVTTTGLVRELSQDELDRRTVP